MRLRFSSAALDPSSVSTATGIMASWFSMVIGLDGIGKTQVGLAKDGGGGGECAVEGILGAMVVSEGGGPDPTDPDARSWGSTKGGCRLPMDTLDRPAVPGS